MITLLNPKLEVGDRVVHAHDADLVVGSIRRILPKNQVSIDWDDGSYSITSQKYLKKVEEN